jgi:hypothetical protein
MRVKGRAFLATACGLVLLGLGFVAGCHGTFFNRPAPEARPEVIRAAGPWTHPPSGMTFPVEVGEFKRSSLLSYDKAGRNVSAQYEIDGAVSRLVMSVYVYPAPPVTGSMREERCGSQLDAATFDLAKQHPGLRRTGIDDVALAQDGTEHLGVRARFIYDQPLVRDALPSAAEIDLFCRATDSWQIEYRFTRPRELAADPIVADFMSRLTWTLHPG